MAKSGGIPGKALFLATAGTFLVYIGTRNVPVLQGLREILKGQIPTARTPDKAITPPQLRPAKAKFDQADDGGQLGDGGSTGGANARIAEAAKKYLHTPYVWGGATPAGFDCSGLVTWVLVRDIGLTNLPSQTHTVTTQFLAWNGAKTIPRDQAAAGDLVCWFGHMGVATDRDNMIHAPQPGERVKISRIWGTPAPQIRRVNIHPDPKGVA